MTLLYGPLAQETWVARAGSATNSILAAGASMGVVTHKIVTTNMQMMAGAAAVVFSSRRAACTVSFVAGASLGVATNKRQTTNSLFSAGAAAQFEIIRGETSTDARFSAGTSYEVRTSKRIAVNGALAAGAHFGVSVTGLHPWSPTARPPPLFRWRPV